MIRRRGRVDGNQKQVVKDLRKVPGVGVRITSGLSDGFPDICVSRKVPVRQLVAKYGIDGFVPMNFLYELKDPAQPPSARALTEDEIEFHQKWPGHKAVALGAQDILDDLYFSRPSSPSPSAPPSPPPADASPGTPRSRPG